MRAMVRAASVVEVFTGFLSLPDGDASTLGRRPSGGHRRQGRDRVVPADDPDSYSGRRQLAQRVQYVRRVSRLWSYARRYGFDALIVLAAIEGAFEVVLRQDAAEAPTSRRGSRRRRRHS